MDDSPSSKPGAAELVDRAKRLAPSLRERARSAEEMRRCPDETIAEFQAAEFLKAGHEVVIYDSLIRGYLETIPEGVTLVQGDVCDRESLDAAFETHQPDAVAHFAALLKPVNRCKSRAYTFRITFRGRSAFWNP